MDFLPIFLDIREQPCLVVGGGEAAERKTALLLRAGGRVTVLAPVLCAAFDADLAAGRIAHRTDRFHADHVAGHAIVIDSSYTRSTVTVTIWGTKIWNIESLSGSRYNQRAFGTIYDPTAKCVSQGGVQGFDIDVTRVFSHGSTQVRTEKFHAQPMSVSDAIVQLNLLHEPFLVFRHDNDGRVAVVYKREDGSYGLIETPAPGAP